MIVYQQVSKNPTVFSVEFMDMVNDKKEIVPAIDPRESKITDNLVMFGS